MTANDRTDWPSYREALARYPRNKHLPGRFRYSLLESRGYTPGIARTSFVTMIDKLTNFRQTMTEFMERGQTADSIETGVFDGTPFTPPRRLVGVPEPNQQHALREAEKILRTARDRPIEDDEQVIQALAKPSESFSSKSLYYLKVAPTAASHPNLEWNGYRLMEDAPEHKSDEWVEAASELEIPTDQRGWKLAPKFVSGVYRALEEITEREGRPVSKWELAKEANVTLAENVEDKAWRYLSELEGVIPPEDDAPAWRYVESAEAEATDADREAHHA